MDKKVKNICKALLEGKQFSESLILESAMDENKVHALLKWLELDSTPENFDRVSVASYNDNVYTIDGVDFLVCTDDEADEEFRDSLENLIDDIGLDAFTPMARDYIIENCIDDDEIIEFYKNDMISYAEDIQNEEDPITITIEDEAGNDIDIECKNRLFKECVEADLIDMDALSPSDFDEDGGYVGDLDLVDVYSDHFDNPTVQGYDDGYDWLKFNFGKDYADQFVKDNCSLDIDAVAEYIKDEDGRGNELNGWNGNEYEEDFDGETYYIYPHDDWSSIE